MALGLTQPLTEMSLFLFLWRDSPQWARASSFTRFLDHTQRRTTFSRTPLDEWSARRRDLYLKTHNTHNRQTSILPVGFEPTISAGERPQTYSLDRAATGTGNRNEQKVKQSHYRPGQALRVSRVWGSQISRQSAHEGGKVVSPTHRPPLPQEIFLALLSVRGWVDPRAIVRPEGFIHLVVCLTTGPKPLRKRALHIVRSRASSFKWEYPLLSLRSSNSFLRLLPCLLVTSIPPCIFPSVTRCRRQFRRKMWPIQSGRIM